MQPKKVLIIEDEKPLAHALKLKLTHEGFDVKSIGNGETMLALLQDDVFSLIICDLVMPKFDGFHVLQTLKDNKIKIPIIILTNLSQAEDKRRVREFGATGFFIKSNTPLSQIVEHVKQVLEK